MRDAKERLRDILDAIVAIERYEPSSRTAFEQNELVQVWFLRHLQVIGEAARALAQETRDRAPDIPWSKIIGMRTILVHNYFEIDLDIAILLDFQTKIFQNQIRGRFPCDPLFYSHLGLLYCLGCHQS